MLLHQDDRVVSREGVLETARATIKATPKIFNFFADQTYANKPKAICRELVANAVDSHVMSGQPDRPVEVWLPSLLDPVFRVRDFGLGMDHEFMMTRFMAYTDGSTKDGDNVAIGGFGIGSKSPFAYVDQYTIVSRFHGTECVYSVFKDDDGIPSIALLGRRVTLEPNGVEVSFPVRQDDFETFEAAAFEALRYFDPLPEIKNAVSGMFTPPEYVTRGGSWAMRPQAGDLGVIMGGIRYPVSTSNLTYKVPSSSTAHKLLTYGIDIKLPIGSCAVALSREALSYDDSTIEAIRTACEAVVDEVAASFATMFDHFDSKWEALTALLEEVGDDGWGRGPRASFLVDHARWRGEEIDTYMTAPMLIDHGGYTSAGYTSWLIARERNRRSRGGRLKPIGSAAWDTLKQVVPGRIETLIIDDLPQTPKSKTIRKIREFCDNSAMTRDILVIRPLEHAQLTADEILAGFGHPPADKVVLTSSLPEPTVERQLYSGAKARVRPKVRMFRFDGSQQRHPRGWYVDASNLNPGQFGKTGVTEIAEGDQPDEGIIVVMEQFGLPHGFVQKMKYDLLNFDELLFVNSSDAKKLDKKCFVDWEAEFNRRKNERLAAYPELPARLALSNCDELSSFFDLFRKNPGLPQLPARTPLGKIQQLYSQYIEPLTEAQRKLAPFVTAKLPARIKPEELREAFASKQWKAARLIKCLPDHLNEEDTKLFLENL